MSRLKSTAVHIAFCPSGFDPESLRQRMKGYLVVKKHPEVRLRVALSCYIFYSLALTNLFTQIKLVDENGSIVDRGVKGELLSRTFSLLSKYKNLGPEAMAELVTDDGYIKTG